MTGVLAVVALSDSFASAWPDLAEEIGAGCSSVVPGAPLPPGTLALLIAAGGEEERALELLSQAGGWETGVPVYLVGAQPSHRTGVEAIRRGATDYFVLPPELDLLRRTLQARADSARAREQRPGAGLADPFRTIIGESPALRRTIEMARRVARSDATVLVTGETGTGKEVLARALHEAGPRAGGPFVAVNCAAIPANLLESELFGHERGAFTDAYQSKTGLMEEADGGTLFLDEVGHLPLELQGKLLRALEDQKIRRIGASQARAVSVRIIAATNVDLTAAVRRGEFREDLFYRIHVVNLELPPLRDRGQDVELLVASFLPQLARRYNVPPPALSPEVRITLQRHAWPGNVRELRHALERALLLSEPGQLDPVHLAPPPTGVAGTAPAGKRLSDAILAATRAAVARCGGNKSAAARELGISRQRLLRIMENEE